MVQCGMDMRYEGSVAEVEVEFGLALEVLSRSWLTYCTKAKQQKKPCNQIDVLTDFALKKSSEFPNICLLINILISTPANSSLIERAYSTLEIICAKRRSRLTPEHIESLFMLSALKLGLWDVEAYVEACLKFLDKE